MWGLLECGAYWNVALIGIGVLIIKNTFEGSAYSKGGAYLKEGAKLNYHNM